MEDSWEKPPRDGNIGAELETWTSLVLSFPGALDGKESTCNVEDLGSIPRLGRSPREEKGYPFQYSTLENSMDCIVHRVANSWT